MRRACDVIGSVVMNITSGENLGRVADLVFDREGRLQGLVLEKQSWFGKPPFLPVSHIRSIGEDLVTVAQPLPETPSTLHDKWFLFQQGQPSMLGTPVVTANGKQLGVLEDVYFDEQLGTIVGYELSDGFFSDMLEGRHMIRQPAKFLFGKDAFVVQMSPDDMSQQ
ncbi:PRC-barrel domain protein [Caldalkalibacillus thermarum TA2.A1]|uniref:PRC-barrel domain protein n=1 Tax=Caldalkalibacillus thermarum (strain TA2.A1) TaxID=986075 RepID=F5L580_CALTT|nr:PRC-barrel domain-containing protein [Caldalkalibacillus thermarum]EGL83510.1 PRC-barrel domain protein [Caldalkalibacillus thermarum TA2.A1]QZT33466.1 PRC-barrel domain-containing protein [Caldalkalibacillus thermarum TA2.A1]GGK16345.1 hypothetical protein GCM10010965_06750 [Caldalkalibacillus thermarum]